jgi:hypothetical protein
MKKVHALGLLAALTLTACGTDSAPIQPSPPAAAPTPSPAAEWTVTQRFVAVTGPDNCWVREQRARWTGAVFPDIPTSITRSGGAITLRSDFFEVNYTGTHNGVDFSATGGPLEGGGRPCQDGTLIQQRPGVSNLSGRFSADDQSMAGNEVNAYLLTSGEAVTYIWGWEARRRP